MKKNLRSILIFIIATILFNFNNIVLAQNYTRIWGNNRYLTSVQISQNGWDKSDVVILATGDDFPDALCATPLAKKYNSPILLNGKTKLDSNVKNEIVRLGTKKVYIIGGKGAISDNIKNEISALGITCERIEGKNRYETSVKIAQKLGASSEVVVSTGRNFPDALSMGAVASIKHMPILLCDTNNIDNYLKEYLLQNTEVNKTYILGGPKVISSQVENNFHNPERIYGSNRYETNIKIINRFSSEINSYSKVYVASGNNFPDALAGSSLASKNSSIVVLTDNNPTVDIRKFIQNEKQSNVNIYILGGEGAVSSSALTKIFYNSLYTISNEKTFQMKQVITVTNNSETNINSVTIKDNIGKINNSPYQKDEKLSVNGNGISIINNAYGEKEGKIYIPSLKSGQSMKYEVVRTFKQGTLKYNGDLSQTSGNYSSFNNYAKYTSPEKKIESNNSSIISKSKEVVGSENNPYMKAKKIFEYVNTTLSYDIWEGNKGALNALKTKAGVCEDYADLFVAMCRAQRIPARVVYGYWIQDDSLDKPLLVNSYGHAWAEFYIPEYGWIVVEPTFIYYLNGKQVPAYNQFAKLPKAGHFIEGYARNTSLTYSWIGYEKPKITKDIYITEIK
ncbi:cell wall-binding repeat-containing protein [Haloimpatiens sp. FM7330]|uniref:cell wall-binding repeat-containing protein n=1 Tax=Haloimpatiens sp. FM7330 TaxID=3298610 RepID=UPI00363DA923